MAEHAAEFAIVRKTGRDPVPAAAEAPGPLPAASVQRARSAPGGLTAQHVRQLQRTLGNRATGALLQRAHGPAHPGQSLQPATGAQPTPGALQRQLKIDDYAWSWVGIPVAKIGFRWATGAEALHTRLKKAFEIDLPAMLTQLAEVDGKEPKTLADRLRAVQTTYDNQPLVYKKEPGKLSGEGLDADLTPLLSQADQTLTTYKQALASDVQQAMSNVGGAIGQMGDLRGEFDRIRKALPKGDDGTGVDIKTLKALVDSAKLLADKARTRRTQINEEKAAKSQATLQTPTQPVTNGAMEQEVKSACKLKGWKERECARIVTDPSDPATKLAVIRRVFGTEIGQLDMVLGPHGLTIAQIATFFFDHGIRSIGALNRYLGEFSDVKGLEKVLNSIGVDNFEELAKRGVPTRIIEEQIGNQGKSIQETLIEYQKSIVTAGELPKKKYDPLTDGVDPHKSPLVYTALEAWVQIYGRKFRTTGVNLVLHHTYQSSYEKENGIGAEYWPNGVQATWVVHVHRGPKGGLIIGSTKSWEDRLEKGHSQKLTKDQLTDAGIPATDTTR